MKRLKESESKLKPELKRRELPVLLERKLPPKPERLRLEESKLNGSITRNKLQLPGDLPERQEKLKLESVLNSKDLTELRLRRKGPESSKSDLND